jgi:hypothetical protein
LGFGVYDVTVYNITGYFNQTQSVTWDSTETLTIPTYQALLLMSTKQLNSIANLTTFNATTGSVINSTTSGSLTLPANAGDNTVTMNPLGHYSQTDTCTAASLTTTSCAFPNAVNSYFQFYDDFLNEYYSPTCELNNSQSTSTGYHGIAAGNYTITCLTESITENFVQNITINSTTTNNITFNVENAHVLLTLTFNKNVTGTLINYPDVHYSDFSALTSWNSTTSTLSLQQSTFDSGLVTVTFNGNSTNQTKGQRFQYLNDGQTIVEQTLYAYTWSTATSGTCLDTYVDLQIINNALQSIDEAEIEVYRLANSNYTMTNRIVTGPDGKALIWMTTCDTIRITVQKDGYDFKALDPIDVTAHQGTTWQIRLTKGAATTTDAAILVPGYMSTNGGTLYLTDYRANRYVITTSNGYTQTIDLSDSTRTLTVTAGNNVTGTTHWCALNQSCIISITKNGDSYASINASWYTFPTNTSVIQRAADNIELDEDNKDTIGFLATIALIFISGALGIVLRAPGTGMTVFMIGGFILMGIFIGQGAVIWQFIFLNLINASYFTLRFLYKVDEQN